MSSASSTDIKNADSLAHLSLGKVSEYTENYTPALLQAVPRSLNRNELNLGATLPFSGVDRWNGYELSWLNNRGKPQIAILRCEVPASSENLIESKSFKLYLNSFNQTKFPSQQAVSQAISQDLAICAGEHVDVRLFKPGEFDDMKLLSWDAICIDNLDIEIDNYQLNPGYLKATHGFASETLCSHLLKSNCLITNQPDWASVLIRYEGKPLSAKVCCAT